VQIAILEDQHRFTIQEQAVPEIGDEQVLVKVAACGVCSSELHVWDHGGANLPRAIGHEVSGIVERVGSDVRNVSPGEPVAVLTGKGFAEWVAVDAESCFPAGDVPLDLALGEPLACAVNAVELADVKLGDDVVVIGAGFMGNLVQQLVSLRGPRHLIVADTRDDALACAASFGATRTVNVTKESLPEAVQELTDGRGADVSFEAVGTQATLTALGEVTRMSGTVAIVGYHQGEPRQVPLDYWNWMAFKIANCHFRELVTIRHGMQTGVRLLTSGRLNLAPLVTHRFPLAEINGAFAAARDKPPGFMKATVVMGL
jgi:L-iditol 2-dehydrogenase